MARTIAGIKQERTKVILTLNRAYTVENKEYMVSIDLGSNNVAIVVGVKTHDGKIAIADSCIREVQGVTRGEIKNIERVAASIEKAVQEVEQKLGIKIIDAFTGISGQGIKCAKNSYYVFVGKDGEIREEDVRKLGESMRNVQAPEGEKIIQIIPQNYIVDGEEEVADPVGMFGKKLEATFNFIIAENNAVNRLQKALAKVGIEQAHMFVNALASAEAVVLPDEKELGVAVLDIGGGTTDITIFHDNMVRHAGVIPIGSNSINKDIRAYGILERYVESLKIKFGSAVKEGASTDKLISIPGLTSRDPKEISFYNLAAIIEARMLDIIEYVQMEIRNSGYEGRLGAGFVITGGGALLKDLDTLIQNTTGQHVRIATPIVAVDDESVEAASDPRLSTAIGLLLKGIELGKKTRVNIEAQQEEEEQQPTPETPSTINDVYAAKKRNSDNETNEVTDIPEDTEEESHEKGRKPGFFKKMIGKFTEIFDVIDDSEI